MTDAHRDLVSRILASPHFAHAQSLQRILRYLFEHLDDADASCLKESEIAVRALGRRTPFDPKIDPIVRVSMGGIRERLQAYFRMEGKNERLHLAIPKGEYKIVFTELEPATDESAGARRGYPALDAFWKPYLATGLPNALIYSELLFFRDEAGNYLRNIYVNQVSGGVDELRRRLPLEGVERLTPSFHFLSAGEVHCTMSLTRAFAVIGATLELKNSRFTSWNELQQANLVLVGSTRTNTFTDALLGDEHFVLTSDHIETQSPAPGEQATYRGVRQQQGKLERLTEYALITRRPGLGTGSALTIIGANHGRAIEGAGQFLADERKMEALIQVLGGDPIPSHFQVLLRVEMLDFDEEVILVEYVAHHVAAPALTSR